MIAETFAFIGVVALIAVVYGEITNPKFYAYCLLGSMMILILGLFTFADGVQFKTGETKIVAPVQTDSNSTNIETDTSATVLGITTTNVTGTSATTALSSQGNETTTYNYANPGPIGGQDFKAVLGLFLLLAGLLGTLSYSAQLAD